MGPFSERALRHACYSGGLAKTAGGQSTALGRFEEKKMMAKANRVGALADEEDCFTVGFGGVSYPVLFGYP